MKLLPFRKRSSPDEALSAYVDGALAGIERAELERRLASEPALREELEEVRAIKQMVASMEDLPAPRSFALGAEFVTVGRPGRLPLVSRVAFGSAAAGLMVAAFATYAMPGESTGTSLSTVPGAPAEDSSAAEAPVAEGGAATEPAVTDNALAGTRVPAQDGSDGVERSAGDAPQGSAELSAEGTHEDAVTTDVPEDSLSYSQQEKDSRGRAPGIAPLEGAEDSEGSGRWRLLQAAGLIVAAGAALAGGAAWFGGRLEVKS
ncbi:MAG: anti-sigma factor family protein [Dehalococcoidia bacterium]